ncbi:MAG: hypothetical protein ACOY7J_14595 [Pseudomonadota bacterium]
MDNHNIRHSQAALQTKPAVDLPASQWNLLSDYLLTRWGSLASAELDAIAGSRQRFVELMRSSYHLSRGEADNQFEKLARRVEQYQCSPHAISTGRR